MAIEHAAVRVARKPWGVGDLHPWSSIDVAGDPIGELWFQRTLKHAPVPSLLLKILFTSEPLSIQVHPNDEFARTMGLPNGKTEAWYILAAAPGARVALGLKRRLTPWALRAAIRDGSIAHLTQWRPVAKGDIIFVPAGTIHAIGAGIVLAEIQQHSDATFRLFDFGRQRDLHEDCAVAVSDAGAVQTQCSPRRINAARIALITSPLFVIERINLPPNSNWALNADRETWLLAIEGRARIGSTDMSVGDAVFIEDDRSCIEVGADGMSGLLAYPGPDPVAALLQDLEMPTKSAGASAGHAPKSSEIFEVQA